MTRIETSNGYTFHISGDRGEVFFAPPIHGVLAGKAAAWKLSPDTARRIADQLYAQADLQEDQS